MMTSPRIGQKCSPDSTFTSCPSSTPHREIRRFAGYVISCCPYSMLGKKILRFLRGEKGTTPEPLTNRELYFQGQVKIGFGIMLIGVFCPIFWFSFLTGARGNELMFNAIHSSIVILLGLIYFAANQIQLRNEQAKKNMRN